jgi:uncharacterized membrane protein
MEIFNAVMEVIFYLLALATFVALIVLGLIVSIIVAASRCGKRSQ